jgi:two-component system, cell cycle sensor histidine kinase and response regulator CckA
MTASPEPNHPPAPTILVVDDAEVIRLLTARALNEEGYTVLVAADGVEALEALERGSVSLVVADLNMPRMDGHELARRIAAGWPDTRMLFITGHPDARLTADLPGPLLMKPYSVEELTDAVRRLLAR